MVFGSVRGGEVLLDDLPAGDYSIRFGASTAAIAQAIRAGEGTPPIDFHVDAGGLVDLPFPGAR